MKLNPTLIHRRQAFSLLAGAGAIAANVGSIAQAATCLTPTPALEEGPYFIDEKLLRSDIRTDPTTSVVQPGVLLTLTVNVQNNVNGVCGPLVGAYVDIWQANW